MVSFPAAPLPSVPGRIGCDAQWLLTSCATAVMNYTEMEAKVREATNNEPWGASSTLMQEIANGTFN